MRRWHRRLRLLMIFGSALVPFVVAIDVPDSSPNLRRWLKRVVVGLSIWATLGATIDEFFSVSDRWYSYRKSAELLKTHGWQFLELSDIYQEYVDQRMRRFHFLLIRLRD